jgi:hypothetical protein
MSWLQITKYGKIMNSGKEQLLVKLLQFKFFRANPKGLTESSSH